MKGRLKTLDIEVAMMHYLNIRQNLIVPNVSWGMDVGGKSLHECDLLSLSASGYATEIEIKVSRSDLLKDKEKRHGHNHMAIANFYYAVPEHLKEIALKSIPTRAGLYVVREVNYRHAVTKVKGCVRLPKAIKWSDGDRMKLARLGTMRILGLKQTVQTLKNKSK